MEFNRMSACETAKLIREGEVSSEEVTRACLDRIDALEETVQAWTWINGDYALEQARRADRVRAQGGALHGVPVGIKDIIDTRDMPTECGTVLYSGRQPAEDATAVSLLRSAGAVILGKTVTTELAFYAPGKTRNPHNPAHTPGGSSSGSAAAVAAGMVPLAVGTQTNGSVIRPAAFCGAVGFKPTYGKISRHGIFHQSSLLDQVGVFANSVGDAALIAEELMSFDGRDPDMRPFPRLALSEAARSPLPGDPRIAFVKSPVWDLAEEDTRREFALLVERLGGIVSEVALPGIFDEAVSSHRAIMHADFALNYADIYRRGSDKLSPVLRETIEKGMEVPAFEYNRAVERIPQLNMELEKLIEEFDALITPAAPGPAPLGLDATGNPIFCTIWTLCGVPAVTLPLLKGANGLPMGVQAVAGRGNDGKLLRVAAWLERRLGSSI
jgi:Asp-tRNA(Asn)/Glu-tRNA(Gln) amidotransferase A subunit family amidase